MLIRSINTVFMKHSRWLFAIFTVVIIISFLGFMVPGRFGVGGCGNPADQAMGQVYGEDISYREAMEAVRGFAVVQELLNGRGYDASNYDYGFYLAAQERAAKQRGISASDKEVSQLICRCAAFQKDGKFHEETYKKVIEKLNRQGIDGDFLVAAFRAEVVRNRLEREVMGDVLVTPGEEKMFYRFYNGTYDVALAEFNAADFVSKVKADDKALRAYFDAHRADYKIPAQMTALTAEMMYLQPALLKEANKLASDAELRKFFAAHASDFADKDGKTPKFEAVAAKVKTAFVAAKVRELAAAQAQRLAREVYDQVGDGLGRDDVFRKTAAKFGFRVEETGVFSADASSAGKIAEPELVKQMNQVLKSVPVTNAVMGKNGVYVGYVLTRAESRPAEWKEASAKVTADFRAQETRKLALKAAEDARARIGKLPEAKRSGDKTWNRRYSVSLWSAMSEAPEKLPPVQVLMELPMLNRNELTKVLAADKGAVFAMVTGWKEPDMAGFEKDKGLWQMLWMRQKATLRSGEFQRELDENCKLYRRDNGK